MTQSFDEYYKGSIWFGTYESDRMMKEAYEAGQQSQQAEINNLKQSYHGASIGHNVFIKQLKERHKAEIDKLQKRIDKAINLIQPSDEISHKLYREIVKTLKEKQDD